MRAHIVRSRGQVAVHGRTPAVAARMPPAVLLVINLRIRAAADCCCSSSSSLLLPDSVKPAVQRGVQNSRGFVPPEAERIRARRPELDGTTRLTETRGTGHGRATEREVASGAKLPPTGGEGCSARTYLATVPRVQFRHQHRVAQFGERVGPVRRVASPELQVAYQEASEKGLESPRSLFLLQSWHPAHPQRPCSPTS